MRVWVIFIGLLLPMVGAAQQQYWGTVATTVQLTGETNPADRDVILLRQGDVIRPETIRASIQALMDTGRYRHVEVEANPAADGTIVTFKVTQHRYFSTFRIEPPGLLERPLSAYFRLPIGEQFSAARVERIREETVKLLG